MHILRKKSKFFSYIYVSKIQNLNLLPKKYLTKRSITGSMVFEEGYVTMDEGKFQTSFETLACAHRWDWLFACVDSTPSAFPCLINIWSVLERMFSCDYTHWQTPTGLRCGYKTCRRPQRPFQARWLSTGSMVTSSSASKALSFVYSHSLWNTMIRLLTILCSKKVMSALHLMQRHRFCECLTVCVSPKETNPFYTSVCREVNKAAVTMYLLLCAICTIHKKILCVCVLWNVFDPCKALCFALLCLKNNTIECSIVQCNTVNVIAHPIRSILIVIFLINIHKVWPVQTGNFHLFRYFVFCYSCLIREPHFHYP